MHFEFSIFSKFFFETAQPADSVHKIEEAEEEVDFDAAEHEEIEPKSEEKKEDQKSKEDNAGNFFLGDKNIIFTENFMR